MGKGAVMIGAMRVGINARILDTEFLRGWSRYTVHLIEELQKLGTEIILFSDRPVQKKWFDADKIKLVVETGCNYLDWEQRILRKLCQQEKVDILHCPINFGLPLISSTKKVLTLHDAIEKAFYDQHKSFFKRWSPAERKMRLYHLLSQMAADHIITVSEHAKQDIVRHYRVSPQKITVIAEAASDFYNDQNVKPLAEIKKNYPHFREGGYFYVGGLEIRKNIEQLLRAYALSSRQRPLVLAGGTQEEQVKLRQLSQSLEISESVVFLPPVAESDLPSLYKYSYCFVYPSFYEGFGLQAVESMKMKKPVLAADNTSLKEVVGMDECLFDPYNTQQMAHKLDWILDKNIYEKTVQKCEQRALDFSWKKSAQQTMDVYKKVLM